MLMYLIFYKIFEYYFALFEMCTGLKIKIFNKNKTGLDQQRQYVVFDEEKQLNPNL